MMELDALDYIARNPARFLHCVPAQAWELSEKLVSDALILGATHVHVVHRNDWWAVSADLDWLKAHKDTQLERYFRQIIPFPEAGQNSLHSEVLVTTFAKYVATWSTEDVRAIKGSMQPDEETWRMLRPTEIARVIAFSM